MQACNGSVQFALAESNPHPQPVHLYAALFSGSSLVYSVMARQKMGLRAAFAAPTVQSTSLLVFLPREVLQLPALRLSIVAFCFNHIGRISHAALRVILQRDGV
jgi:hypothetical protein